MPHELAEEARLFLRSLSDDALVIELGSGRCVLAGEHPNLVLTDYSLYALRTFGVGARVQLDAQVLPFRDGSVDAFLSIAMIEHVPRPELVLAEIDRCLAPGGRAFLFPAWLVFPWASKNLSNRPYRELRLGDRVRKALIPLRRRPIYRFARALPRRMIREARLAFGRAVPFEYRRLEPDLGQYLTSDSDAFTSIDPHACAVYFASKGYAVAGFDGVLSRLLIRYVPVVVTKPAQLTTRSTKDNLQPDDDSRVLMKRARREL